MWSDPWWPYPPGKSWLGWSEGCKFYPQLYFGTSLCSMPFLCFVVCKKDINFCSGGWNFHASPSSCS